MSVLCENLQYLDKLTILSLYRIYIIDDRKSYW